MERAMGHGSAGSKDENKKQVLITAGDHQNATARNGMFESRNLARRIAKERSKIARERSKKDSEKLARKIARK
ncbi:hypothetical protein Tco_0379564 [Tanacetum coccineum]